MVSLIAGKKGTGKSKRMIKMANDDINTTAGHIVFIDDDKRNMFDLHHDLRFINMDDYSIGSYEEFYGFLCGLISNDYDIEKIYIDGMINSIDNDLPQVTEWLEKADELSQKHNIDFVMAMNYEEQLPVDLQSFAL